MEKVRIDKWLWAARFFKTRALAKAAIEGGKVHMAGQRVKASKELKTEQSLLDRERRAAERKAANNSHYPPDQRPNKKQRRQIHRFQREQNLD